jgi:carbon-monoxide dehydrogenase large subunit
MAANHSREIICDAEIAAKRDGTLLGLRASVYGDMCGYVRTHGGIVPAHVASLLPLPYRLPNYEGKVHCVMTNKTGVGTVRAPGAYEACFIMERFLDIVAADLNIDPVEIRRKNLIPPEEMPYEIGRTRPGSGPTILDSGDYPSALRQAVEKFGYEQLKKFQGRCEDGKYHGIGVAFFVKNTGRGPHESARVAVGDGNRITVYLGIASLGQGHETVMAQICADTLGVPIEQITVLHGSTDLLPSGGGTYASRATVMGGNALFLAAQKLREKILRIAASYLGATADQLTLRDGQIFRDGVETDKPLLALDQVVELARPSSRHNREEPGLDVTAQFDSNRYTYTYGVQMAHVRVDSETGHVEILRYLVLEDIGRCINPMLVHGQIVGAAAQGIGATLLEELVYNEDGQPLTTTFMDYLLPTSTDVPRIESIVTEEYPSQLNPLGVKGAGEGGIVATGAVLANAVAKALAPLGVKVIELPLSPDRVKTWIRSV